MNVRKATSGSSRLMLGVLLLSGAFLAAIIFLALHGPSSRQDVLVLDHQSAVSEGPSGSADALQSPLLRSEIAPDVGATAPSPDDILSEEYGLDAARIREGVDAQMYRLLGRKADWSQLRPWDEAYSLLLDLYSEVVDEELFRHSKIDWPGVQLDAPVEPASGAALDQLVIRFQRMTSRPNRITTDIASLVDAASIPLNAELQQLAIQWRGEMAAEVRRRVRSGQFRRAPMIAEAANLVYGSPRDQNAASRASSLMVHTHQLAGWAIEVNLAAGDLPGLDHLEEEIRSLQRRRDLFVRELLDELISY